MAIKFSVELPLFFAFFSFSLINTLNTNLIIYRTCYLILGFDKNNCSLLGNVYNATTEALEKIVQPKADVIMMTKTSIDSVFGAILCLFVGSWSDRFGRKPVIVANFIGYTVMMWIMTAFAALEEVSPWYMLMCTIPVVLSGGGASFLAILLAYLTDITSVEHRGLQMGIFEAFMGAAVLLGLLYVILLIPESLETIETGNKIRGFFQTQNIVGMFKTTLRERPGYGRSIILLLVVSLAIYFTTVAGDTSVIFLFMREQFHWTFKQFTYFSSFCSINWILGSIILVYVIHHKWKVQESFLILIGFVTMTIGAFIQGLAQVDWLIYFAAVIKIPSTCISPMTKSMLSKLVEDNESAKIFAVFTIMSNLLGLVGAPLFTTLYNATMGSSPGIFNFVTGSGQAMNTIYLLVVIWLLRRTQSTPYSSISNENQDSVITPQNETDN
ncbi:tetracycline resistance protein, class C-like isoform X2 [Sitophilus oryzae]|uniref:Tetracycline resistance protein, class C-like isoform X2 n=1 Tax=Sitophilus oryzae TaxID=7048 RepID=A0A6J2XIZ2_SITOR|nr:tetracycline resistance protein, class C-like isoform X2 [Sitophilus oryzae]